MPDARVRVGLGYDVHPFADVTDTRPLVLAGVHLDGPGLAGHSDADAVAHAVEDLRLRGASGLALRADSGVAAGEVQAWRRGRRRSACLGSMVSW